VSAAAKGFSWREKGALSIRFPLCTVEFLAAIEAFSSGVNQQQSDQMRKSREAAKAKRKSR
jgi:hypothetical protein